MTIDPFLNWHAGQRPPYELVDGDPIPIAGAKLQHDRPAAGALCRDMRLRVAGKAPWSPNHDNTA